jgi:hypothetical protein
MPGYNYKRLSDTHKKSMDQAELRISRVGEGELFYLCQATIVSYMVLGVRE